MQEVPTKEVGSFKELLSILTGLQRAIGNNLWFRGVRDKNFQLVPGLYRNGVLASEASFVSGFLVGYRAYVATTPDNPWDLYSLMQHHGLPTRLLDWSRSPLHALFFSLQDLESEADCAVWAINPYELNSLTLGVDQLYCPGGLASRAVRLPNGETFNLDSYLPEALDPLDHFQLPEAPIAIEARYSNARVKSQLGCFTVHGSQDVPLESWFPEDSRNLFRLTIKAEQRRSFLEDLYVLGVNEETIYQDLDSLVMRIKRERIRG